RTSRRHLHLAPGSQFDFARQPDFGVTAITTHGTTPSCRACGNAEAGDSPHFRFRYKAPTAPMAKKTVEKNSRVAPGVTSWGSHRSGSARHNTSIVTSFLCLFIHEHGQTVYCRL